MTTKTSRVVVLAALVVAAALLALACSGRPARTRSPLTRNLSADAPDLVKTGCRKAARQCVQCHPVQRLLVADVDSPRHWQRYVQRMRMMPGSGITKDDADVITRCLVYRSFGADGLTALNTERSP